MGAGVILRASSTAIAATASGSIVNPRLSVLLARADVEILKSSLRIYPETSMTWLITATVMVLLAVSVSVTITRLYASSFDRGGDEVRRMLSDCCNARHRGVIVR